MRYIKDGLKGNNNHPQLLHILQWLPVNNSNYRDINYEPNRFVYKISKDTGQAKQNK